MRVFQLRVPKSIGFRPKFAGCQNREFKFWWIPAGTAEWYLRYFRYFPYHTYFSTLPRKFRQDMAEGLRSSNQQLQGELDAERTARLQILHQLQQLKRTELEELKEVGQLDRAISPVTLVPPKP